MGILWKDDSFNCSKDGEVVPQLLLGCLRIQIAHVYRPSVFFILSLKTNNEKECMQIMWLIGKSVFALGKINHVI
jgi:hypothetical protein